MKRTPPANIVAAVCSLLQPYFSDLSPDALLHRLRLDLEEKKTETEEPKLLLRISDVAKRWNCSKRQVWRLIERGDVPVIRIGSKNTRFRICDLEEYETQSQERRKRPNDRGSEGRGS